MRRVAMVEWFARLLRLGSVVDVDRRADERDAHYQALQKEIELYRHPPFRPADPPHQGQNS